MAKTVCLINMKGGVGKSTLTVNLAWHFFDRVTPCRVLVVDLDPQFNASQYLLGVHAYERHLQAGKPTIWDVFEQSTRIPSSPSIPLDVKTAICNRCTRLDGNKIDLIPSRLELAWTLKAPQAKEKELAKSLEQIKGEYELILIDCAPTESMLTLAAYLASDYVLVPVKPDYLSAIGLPLLENSLREFHGTSDHRLEIAGVVFNATTEYSPEEMLTKNKVREQARERNWYVFRNEIALSRSYPKGAREGLPISRTSYAHGRQARYFNEFAEEFRERIQT